MYMDNDCFVYDREGIKCWFKNLGDYDFTAPVAKTSLRLREILWKKCPKLQEKGISTFWGNHFLIRKRFFEKAGKIDWNEYDPFPEGTYLPELDYTTKKGDYGEPACRFYWNIFLGNNWVDMPIVSNQGFHHLHSMSMAYLLIDCKKQGYEDYKKYIEMQPLDKVLQIIGWYELIDTKGRFVKEIREVKEDLLKTRI